MELNFEKETTSTIEMKNAHNKMIEFFGDMVRLEKYFGPVQMGVWVLEYSYSLEKYKIIIESERGFIEIRVYNDRDEIFYPKLIYSEADYFHFADKERDVYQLINLTKRAIDNNAIVFFTEKEIVKYNKKKK